MDLIDDVKTALSDAIRTFNMAASSSQNVFRWYVAFGGFLYTRNSLLSDSL